LAQSYNDPWALITNHGLLWVNTIVIQGFVQWSDHCHVQNSKNNPKLEIFSIEKTMGITSTWD